MSWDFSMQAPPCPTCGRSESDGERLEANYTYTVAPMFREAFGLSLDCGIRSLNGMTGAKACPLISAALDAMRADPDRYRAMEPENGWGSFADEFELLKKIGAWCAGHPDWTLRVS